MAHETQICFYHNASTLEALCPMPRRTKPQYLCSALAALSRQLLYAPEPRRIEQLTRAEHLHDELEIDGLYPLEFIIYRITGYRSPYQQEDLLVGQAVQRDLRMLIDQLSYSIHLPDVIKEATYQAEQLAAELNVSTKTLARWRKLGLRWRWETKAENGNRYVVYPQRGVAWFRHHHPEMIARAAAFTHIPEAEKERILARARRLVQARNITPHQLASFLARRTGRSVETLRQLLLKHDELHPQEAIFQDRTRPLDAHQKRVIVRAHRMGVPMRLLCLRFNRTRATLYRVIHEARANAFRRLSLAHQVLATFDRDDAAEIYLRPLQPLAEGDLSKRYGGPVDDLPEAVRTQFAGPMISTSRQQSLIVRIHYRHYRAYQLRSQLDRYTPKVHDLDQIEVWVQEAEHMRLELLHGTAPLVLAVVRRHLLDQPDIWVHRLLPLLQQTLRIQEQCVFDYDMMGKTSFQAYLTWALMRHLAGMEATHLKKTSR